MDRGGNMVSKIPSNALSQVKFKGRKIIIPYNGKRYVIVRCKNDNEKQSVSGGIFGIKIQNLILYNYL